MEKKAKECKSWKLRALKAEKELQLTSRILTHSQLEELQRQNVVLQCGDSPPPSDASANASMESCQAIGKPHDPEHIREYVTVHKEQHKVSGDNVQI